MVPMPHLCTMANGNIVFSKLNFVQCMNAQRRRKLGCKIYAISFNWCLHIYLILTYYCINLTWFFDHEWLLVVIRAPSFLIWDFLQFYWEVPTWKTFWNVNKQLKNTKTFWNVNKQLSLSNQYQNFFILTLRDCLTEKGKLCEN